MRYNFRDIVPNPDDPRIKGIAARDAYEHAAERLSHPLIGSLFFGGREKLKEPFKGLSTDGSLVPDLFHIADEGAPTPLMVAAAKDLLEIATPDEAAVMRKDIESPDWRYWMNPEIYMNQLGLRLDELRDPLRDAILRVLEASMSPAGYEKARNCMRMNHFLGEVVNAPKVMNEYSYNFQLFGKPSLTEPWGWNFWGHHLCLNCFILGSQMVISPTFMGAEPNIIDEGPWKGLTIFNEEENLGLKLMQSLSKDVQEKAQIYKLMDDPLMPKDRFHLADQRHLGGAFQDNRIVPYEGVEVARTFSVAQQKMLLQLIEAFICYLPEEPLRARMRLIEQHLPETRWAWIGSFDDDAVFYYKIQSPVILVEFDHHSGVFLTNEEPWKCHIHTLVRTPNGNDYGKELYRLHCECGAAGRRGFTAEGSST